MFAQQAKLSFTTVFFPPLFLHNEPLANWSPPCTNNL